MNNSVDHNLEISALANTLADSFDQLVFLEKAVKHISACQSLEDTLPILEEARRVFGAKQAALSVAGKSLTPIPKWLAELAEHRVIMTQPALIVPFEQGWSAFWDRDREFGTPELKIAETLGRLMTTLQQNLEQREKQQKMLLEQHEQHLAAQLWRTLMIERQGQLSEHRWQAWYEPARDVGGDFYLAEREWVVIGDISGKGLSAAVLSGMFQVATRLALQQPQPVHALEQALLADFTRTGMFCTVFAAKFLGHGELGYLNMGHPAALIFRTSGEVQRLPATTIPFGVLAQGHLELQRAYLQANDMLVMVTDGVTEATRLSTLYGQERLVDLLLGSQNPQEVIARVRTTLRDWEIEDDVCVMAVQYIPEMLVRDTADRRVLS